LVLSLHRKVLVAMRLKAITTHGMVVALVLALLVTLDWLVRWPWPIRVTLLCLMLIAWIRALRVVIERGWTRAPSPRSVALRLERLEPVLSGTLASAMDF